MYGLTTPEHTKSFEQLDVWEDYVAHIFYNLMYFCDIDPHSTLIEVGPGASIKIPRALSKLNFTGTLHLVEPHVDIGPRLQKTYLHFLPQAEIFWHPKTFAQAINDLPTGVDAILGNHVLDDMLLFSANEHQHSDFDWSTYSDSYLSDTQRVQESWKAIKKNKGKLTQHHLEVLQTWKKAITQLAPERVILSQYKSYYLTHYAMQELDDWGWKIMRQLKKSYADAAIPQLHLQRILNSMKNYNDQHIGQHVLNPKYWSIIQPRQNP